jgi:hypothetical protein
MVEDEWLVPLACRSLFILMELQWLKFDRECNGLMMFKFETRRGNYGKGAYHRMGRTGRGIWIFEAQRW